MLPWTIDERLEDGIVLVNTHPMRVGEAMALAIKIAKAAKRVHAYAEAKKARAAAAARVPDAIEAFDPTIFDALEDGPPPETR